MPPVIQTSRLLIACAALASPAVAQAQARGFAVNRFEPAHTGSDWFANESLDLRGELRPSVGLVVDWAYQPLVIYAEPDAVGDERADALTDQIFVHVGGGVVLADALRLNVSLPVALYQHGDALDGLTIRAAAPRAQAVGDLRLSSDVRLFGTYGQGFTAAAGVQVHLPTGEPSHYTGDDTVRIEPRFFGAGNFEWFACAARLGLAYRFLEADFEGRKLGSELVFGAAAGVKVNDRFTLGPELHGSTVLGADSAFARRNTPIELLLGAHVTLAGHWQAGAGVGPGLTRGDGSPRMRVLATIAYAPDVCVDKDGDGLCEESDACPDVQGVRTSDPRTRGCPPSETHAPAEPLEGR